MAYNGWLIGEDSKNLLMILFPPKYPDVVAHHVTRSMTKEQPDDAVVRVIGYADDGEGVECLVVEVNGTHERPGGSIYHITWSIDREAGRKPVHSNDVLLRNGFDRLVYGERSLSIPINTTPFVSET